MTFTQEDAQAYVWAGRQLALDPRVLGGATELESGSNPNIKGGAGGEYEGLIQFSKNARREVGLPSGPMTIAQQMPYVVKYLQQRGFKPGVHGPTELYRTVLVGNPNQSGTDSFGTNSDSAARRMMPGGDLYQHFSAKFDPVAPSANGVQSIASGQPAQKSGQVDSFDPGALLQKALTDLRGQVQASVAPSSPGDGVSSLAMKALNAGFTAPRFYDVNSVTPRTPRRMAAMPGAGRPSTAGSTLSPASRDPAGWDILNQAAGLVAGIFGGPAAQAGASSGQSVAQASGGQAVAQASSGSSAAIEYLTGDPSHRGYRADHGGSNYHEHIAFASQAARDQAIELLRSQGIQIGSVNDGRHAPGSYHYSNQAFDVPASQVPVGQERALSRRVRSLLGIA